MILDKDCMLCTTLWHNPELQLDIIPLRNEKGIHIIGDVLNEDTLSNLKRNKFI